MESMKANGAHAKGNKSAKQASEPEASSSDGPELAKSEQESNLERFSLSAARQPEPRLDEVDLLSLRVDQSHSAFRAASVKQVRVRTPGDSWFRAHPENDFSLVYGFMADGRDMYLVDPALHEPLHGYITYRHPLVCCSSTDDLFVWLLAARSEWGRSGASAAKMALTVWVQITNGENGYTPRTAPETGEVAALKPNFPAKGVLELIAQALEGRLITSLDHWVVQRRLGFKK